MTSKALEDYDLTLPPVSLGEMNRVNAEIQSWHSSGGKLSETPVDALITNLHQTISTARRLLNDLEGEKSQSIPLHRKQKFLDNFRSVLQIHAGNQLDVAGLQARAANVQSEIEATYQKDAAANWEKLIDTLKEKETLMETLAKKVEDLEAECEKEQWSDAAQFQDQSSASSGGHDG